MEDKKDFKYIVRIVNSDIDGKHQIAVGLTRIKGVGHVFANAICDKADIDKRKITGELSDAEVAKLEEVIKSKDFPTWMFNRRKDPETGEDTHLIGADIKFIQENDVKLMKKSKSYKGSRHQAGLPARGQRTKSNFRKNKGKAQGAKKKRK